MPLKDQIQDIASAMRKLVLQGASEQGPVRLHTAYADNYWTVEAQADGSTRYENYAEEARGPRGSIADLSLGELALLLQSLT